MASKQLQSHVQLIALSKPQHSADLHVPINDNEAHPHFNKLQVSGSFFVYGVKLYTRERDMIWYDMIWYDMIWYDIWYDMIWYDMNGMVWHDIDIDMTWAMPCEIYWSDIMAWIMLERVMAVSMECWSTKYLE